MILSAILFTTLVNADTTAPVVPVAPVPSATPAPRALPPKKLYHIGQKPLLLENGKHGNIPQSAWDRFIMGADTRYGLVPYRRGLYGGTNFDNLELYGNLYVGDSKVPWVMTIYLKEECRTAEASTNFEGDPRYQDWFITQVPGLLQELPECLTHHPETCSYTFDRWNGVAYGKTNPCDVVPARFLQEYKIKVVEDGAWEDSWYIRDRSCIETIRSEPEDVLEVLADAKWDWENRKSTHSPTPAYGAATVAMLVGALGDVAGVSDISDELLAKVREKAAKSDIAFSFEDPHPVTNKVWAKETAPAAIDAFQRCRSKEKLSEFKRVADGFGKELQLEKAKGSFREIVASLTRSLQSLCN